MLYFASDYQEGCHPAILERFVATNMESTGGYGQDPYSAAAKAKIREACAAPEAQVEFFIGGTETNSTVIRGLLRPFEAVFAAETGHIAIHEAGAIEAGGHKVLTLPAREGKITPEDICAYLEAFYKDPTHTHMPQPRAIYISQPTEIGTLYSEAELLALRKLCDRAELLLFVDGARLGYALGAPANDVSLPRLTELADVFYIGGTKVGCLFGEAVVFPRPFLPHFFTTMKQSGAVLAKGRLLGLQFDTLFTDGLYERLGRQGTAMALRLKEGLLAKGYELFIDSPTNQQFITVPNDRLETLGESLAYSYWAPVGPDHTAIRLCTAWCTTEADVDAVLALL